MAKFTITHDEKGNTIYTADFVRIMDLRNGKIIVDGEDFTDVEHTGEISFNIIYVNTVYAEKAMFEKGYKGPVKLNIKEISRIIK